MKHGDYNSQIELLFGILPKMFHDLYRIIDPHNPFFPFDSNVELARDLAYVDRRVKNEGLKFLTVTLPLLGKWVDSLLEGGLSSPPLGFAPFYKVYIHAEVYEVPRFMRAPLSEMVATVATIREGGPTEKMDSALLLVKAIRTVCYCFYKLETPIDSELLEETFQKFKSNDDDAEVPWCRLSQAVIARASMLCERILKEPDGREFIDLTDIIPKHGPGAVASGERDEQKWEFSHLYSSLHQVYPYYDYMYGVRAGYESQHLRDNLHKYKAMLRNSTPTSKVVAVPKDSRGPRIICAEPLEYQFIQQGVANVLTPHLEKRSIARGQINFEDQTVNASLALTSSATREFATIDLKDASDLVSLDLARSILPEKLWKYFAATRSTHARLPNGEVIQMKKFAPMGSALCFPVESLLFYCISVAALINEGIPEREALRLCYVYGDDIIVPTVHVIAVIGSLEMVGLRVNQQKCCYRSYFRESCGCDAFAGVDITPQRIKKVPGRGPLDGNAHRAWLAYASLFWSMKFFQSAMYCIKVVEESIGCRIPITKKSEDYLSAVIPDLAWTYERYPKQRWNADLQRLEAFLWVTRPVTRETTLGSWERMLRSVTSPIMAADPTRVVVKDATKMTKRWVAIPLA